MDNAAGQDNSRYPGSKFEKSCQIIRTLPLDMGNHSEQDEFASTSSNHVRKLPPVPLLSSSQDKRGILIVGSHLPLSGKNLT
jgi:hypothetical protein